jgi:hypothetical protein
MTRDIATRLEYQWVNNIGDATPLVFVLTTAC